MRDVIQKISPIQNVELNTSCGGGGSTGNKYSLAPKKQNLKLNPSRGVILEIFRNINTP